MAVNSVVDSFIPEIWDTSIMRTLEDNLVAKKVCQNYSSKISKAGDTIHFNGLTDPTIGNYAGTVSYETLKAGRMSLIIDTDKYYGFDVEDIDEAMSNVDIKGSQTQRAAYKLAQTLDTSIMSLYASALAGTVTDSTCDTTTVLSDIGLLKRYLMENGVSENDMWLVIPPWVQLVLELAGIKFSINEGISGKGGMSWAKNVLGFETFVTNQVVETAATPVSEIMAGSYNAIGFAMVPVKSESLRAETAFATHVRGRLTYGCKVLKPYELARATLTYTAETSI